MQEWFFVCFSILAKMRTAINRDRFIKLTLNEQAIATTICYITRCPWRDVS